MPRHGVRAAGGGRRVAHERNLGRAAIWHARPAESSLLPAPSVLYGREFRQVDGRPLTGADQRLLAELTTRWLDSGSPSDGRVRFTLGDAARAQGHRLPGGEQRRAVRDSLNRLARCRILSTVRHGDGHETEWDWGLLSSFGTTSRAGGRGAAVLSEEVRTLLIGDSITWLDARVWDAIARDDEIAARLWVFLETENFAGARTWRYHLFDNDARRSLPSVAQLLRLDHWATRKTVAHRVRAACRVIAGNDGRYTLDLLSISPGHWRLEVGKSAGTQTSAAASHQLPDEVLSAWRAAYRQHLPSARQAAALLEILGRQPVDEVVATLRSARRADPFRSLMVQDRRCSKERVADARRAEDAWAAAKAREVAGAQRLRDILAEALRPSLER